MTTAVTTARDEVRATAAQNHWVRDNPVNDWVDIFTRIVTLDPATRLAKVFAVSEQLPREQVVVRYDAPGRIVALVTYGPGDQSVLLGTHFGGRTIAAERRAAVRRALSEGVGSV